MKFLILVAVVVAVLWLARGGRRRVSGNEQSPPRSPPQEAMVACTQCGLHLPRSEALPGRGGLFCSEVHRAAFEKALR
jgi:uncharacterized protein